MNAISLFSSGGVGELLLSDLKINMILANELIEKRAKFYSETHKNKIVIGDITQIKVKQEIYKEIGNTKIDLIIATPPCQGVSSLGKNKKHEDYINDDRNFLVFHILEFIDKYEPNYVLIENVERYSKMYFPYKGDLHKLVNILFDKYNLNYEINDKILNSKDYGVPQSRPRYFIKLFKKGLKWPWPVSQEKINLKDAIGHLPSLESGQISNIPWHYAKKHNVRDIIAMKHTPTGKSAMKNEFYYPKRADGKKISGFHNTYKRLEWNLPCHARTTNSGNIGSHNNVHPGRKLIDGTYSDARVLSILELMLVSSIPIDWKIPSWASDTFIRHIIGESVPPLLMRKVIDPIT